MKKNVSRFFAALLLCALLLTACGKSARDVPAEDLANAVLEAIGKSETMTDSTETVVVGYMHSSPDQFGDCAVYHNSYGTGVDEFGIFKAGTLKAAEVRTAVEDYLEMVRKSSMAALYTPEEMPKLDGAEVRTVGDYVIYCVLSDADRDTAFKTFENALK